jgi:hypothetical protein
MGCSHLLLLVALRLARQPFVYVCGVLLLLLFFFLLYLFEVFEVEAIALRGEGCSVFGMGHGTNVCIGLGILDVGGSDLESVEKQSGSLGIESMGGEGLEDVDEGELDGGGIFGGREVEAGADCSRAFFSAISFASRADRDGAAVDGLLF